MVCFECNDIYWGMLFIGGCICIIKVLKQVEYNACIDSTIRFPQMSLWSSGWNSPECCIAMGSPFPKEGERNVPISISKLQEIGVDTWWEMYFDSMLPVWYPATRSYIYQWPLDGESWQTKDIVRPQILHHCPTGSSKYTSNLRQYEDIISEVYMWYWIMLFSFIHYFISIKIFV